MLILPRRLLVFLKGGPGSGFEGHKGRGEVGGSAPRDVASSAEIQTEPQARAYWRRKFNDRVADFTVPAADGDARRFRVLFSAKAEHGYTDHVLDENGKRTAKRKFSAKRAALIDQIEPTISAPSVVLASPGRRGGAPAHLFIARLDDNGNGHVVALKWMDDRNIYAFASAYPVTSDEWAALRSDPNYPTHPAGDPVEMRKAEGAGGRLAAAPQFPNSSFENITFGHLSAAPRAHQAVSSRDGISALTEIVWDFDAFFKAIPPGARWITVRPNGPGTEGQPVLIQPEADGAARVIGGAGGKLNYLKLTGVKSEAEYKESVHSNAASRQEARKRQRERDKADGLTESKAAAREALRAEVGQHQAKFVSTVADAMGWKPEDLRFPEEKFANVSEGARKAAARKHAGELLARAKEAVDQQRQVLVHDAAARSEGGIAEVPLTGEDPASLTVQDLSPVNPVTSGLGFSPDYGKRAEAAGLKPEALKQEAADSKPPPPSDGKPTAGQKASERAKAIADELQAIRDPLPKLANDAVLDAKKAVDLLKAEKALKAVNREARDKGRLIDAAKVAVEPKAYVLETAGPVNDDIKADIENDLRTLRTRSFLDEIGRQPGGAASLGQHIGSGAFNALNSVALATAGTSMVDRSVVDVLGIAGAAQVIARRLQRDLTPQEVADAHEAMQRYHVEHYMNRSESALREAREWQEMAHEIEVDPAANGAELAVAQEMNAKRRDFTRAAQQVLGTSLGEMEANASISLALGRPAKDKIDVSLGKTSIESAIQQARALGLERGDYQVERVGASTIMTVHGSGMDKLAAPVSRDDLQRTKAAMAIINGDHDEDDWLPAGVANRPEMAMNVPPGTAPQLARPFPAKPADMDLAVSDFIGGRAADGDSAGDIIKALLSEDTLQLAGDRGAFMAAVEKVAPLYGADGQMVRAEAHQDAFNKLADDYSERAFGGKLAPIHRQDFPVDATSVEALHRALAAHPAGVAAFKPVGDMSPQDQGALRAVFGKEYGKVDPKADGLRQELAKLDAAEPERETEDMFGRSVNPAWREWQADRNGKAEALNQATMTWSKYVDSMGGPANAYRAMQDTVKGDVLDTFADTHNRLRPGAPLKVGNTVIAHDLSHLDALDPAARERRQGQHRQLVDGLRNRVAGQYSAGSVSEKLDAARAADEAANQAQMGLFGMDPAPAKADAEPEAKPLRPAELGERRTIGLAAERKVAGMMSVVGSQFQPGQAAVPIWKPTMSGHYVGRQRAVKLIQQNKRMMLGLGTGSGKTSISLAAFTHLHAAGQAKRGMFLVPSVVQGQFHGEALTLLEPGKFKWHANPGASRDERIAAYKDPKVNFNVVTHQAFRDDVLHMAAKQNGTSHAAVAEKLDGMKPAERQTYLRGVLEAEGIDHDYLAVDEGHNLLNRAGKDNSRLANVVDGVADGMPHYVNMSADPVKNDASEVFDILSKMDRTRYTDRDAFMRKYGVNTPTARDGLQREMARHFYTGRIDPGVKAEHKDVPVELAPDQVAHLDGLNAAAVKARAARRAGRVDVDAMKVLSPNSFADVPEAQHEAVATDLQRSIGIIHETAVQHGLGGTAKTDAVAKIAGERRGKQGVVFARHLDHVEAVAKRLQAEGHRVVTLTGKDSSKDKDRKKAAFQRGEHDVIVMSDAGAVGANLQNGKWLAQYDTPTTAMVHAQRNGRIHRIGQKDDVELLNIRANHPSEARAVKRLGDKYALRDVMSSPLDGLDDRGLAGMLKQVQAGKADAEQPHYPPAQPHETADQMENETQGSMF